MTGFRLRPCEMESVSSICEDRDGSGTSLVL